MSAADGQDSNGTTNSAIEITWRSRFARLGSPGAMATIQRVFLDHIFSMRASTEPSGFRVRVLDTQGTVLADVTSASQLSSGMNRQRFQFECFGEADAAQLEVTNGTTTVPAVWSCELYDAYIEYVPGQNRGSL